MRISVIFTTVALLGISLSGATAAAKQFSVLGALEISNVSTLPHNAPTLEAVKGPTRELISLTTNLSPGSILVRTQERKLYFILPDGQALAFMVAVGREGFAWHGTNTISRKAEWPDWRPPPEMLAREAAAGHIIPDMVKGGPGNPLGARALYLGDSDYRIHGTDKPWSIGQASSSGCIRMLNEHVTELYGLVKIGAKVVVE